jgi:hypothetical protein
VLVLLFLSVAVGCCESCCESQEDGANEHCKFKELPEGVIEFDSEHMLSGPYIYSCTHMCAFEQR